VTSVTHRERLLAAARELLESKGYAHTTARDLVAVSGTNLGSIAYHFGTKEALLDEAIGNAFVDWTRQVMEAVLATTAGADPVEAMLAGWRGMLERVEANRALMAANLEAMGRVARSAEVRERVARAYEECRATIAAGALDYVPEGFEAHARVIASFLMAVVDGMALQRLSDPQGAPDTDQLIESLRLMFAAVRARPSP
jgi:AcrR family transcriptional regulator